MLKVKPFRQKAGLCGVASLKMVLEYFGCQKSEAELIKLTGATTGQGTSAQGIKKAAQKLGFSVKVKDKADFQDIKYWLVKKVPPMVDWFSPFGAPEGHYSVVVGLDKNFIYLQDPEIAGVRKIKKQDFKRIWFDFEGDFIKNRNDLILRRLLVLEKNGKN
jgi:ABC-type bacteriocin/lantibiotic exporter with double-glycine peptidase domain